MTIGTNALLFNVVIYWTIFFLPIYLQSVKFTSPMEAGIDASPIALLGAPTAAAAVNR